MLLLLLSCLLHVGFCSLPSRQAGRFPASAAQRDFPVSPWNRAVSRKSFRLLHVAPTWRACNVQNVFSMQYLTKNRRSSSPPTDLATVLSAPLPHADRALPALPHPSIHPSAHVALKKLGEALTERVARRGEWSVFMQKVALRVGALASEQC